MLVLVLALLALALRLLLTLLAWRCCCCCSFADSCCFYFFCSLCGRWLVFSGRIDAARKSLQFVTPGISELAVAEIQVCTSKVMIA